MDDLDQLDEFNDEPEEDFVDFVQDKNQKPSGLAQFQDYLKDKFMKELKTQKENK